MNIENDIAEHTATKIKHLNDIIDERDKMIREQKETIEALQRAITELIEKK